MNPSDAQPWTGNAATPAVGVVIPTFNRADALLECLRHLEAQTCKDFEVVVVDDGSTDRTREALAAYAPTAPFPLRTIHQPNSGPAPARNRAIAALTAPLCLMIGDDTFPTPEFVGVHLQFHRDQTALEDAAVGLTRWSETGQTVTPLMRWLESDGVQFANRELLEGKPASWRHFYTSNLSVKTALLQQNPFDEGFPTYGLEDIELGRRLANLRGLRMTFLRDAINDHVHPTTFTQTCRRADKIGMAMYHFEKLCPEERIALGKGWKGKIVAFLTGQAWAMAAVTAVAQAMTAIQVPNPILLPVIQLHHIVGYRRAQAAGDAARVSSQFPKRKPVC